ncbi:MAG TPA: proline dehydrogenase family protein [Chloroflexia bacterium]|nr:proline dehydrogenase family protein [Chloroflexia bacterium]
MLRQGFLTLSQSKGLRDFAVANPLARKVARRFVAGEQLDEAVRVIADLNRRGMFATFDLLGENVNTREDADATADAYLALLDAIERNKLKSNVSLKLTAMGLDLGESIAVDNLRRILDRARQYGKFVRIDMEGSEYTDVTLAIFRRLWQDYQNVGVVLQAYLYRTPQDVDEMIRMKVRVRLCKGAYNEPPSVAFPEKKDTDLQYARLMCKLIEQGNYPGIATHDVRLINLAKRFVAQKGIPANRFEFQMLYGIRTGLQQQLADDGYHMRVYVPYGEQWYPYFMRRLAERPANLIFILSNLFRK